MGKIGPKFSHLLTVRAEGADPPPYGQPDCKKTVFFLTTALSSVCFYTTKKVIVSFARLSRVISRVSSLMITCRILQFYYSIFPQLRSWAESKAQGTHGVARRSNYLIWRVRMGREATLQSWFLESRLWRQIIVYRYASTRVRDRWMSTSLLVILSFIQCFHSHKCAFTFLWFHVNTWKG